MTSITSELAKNAVNLFLESQFNKKTDKEQKQLAKARENEDEQKIAELEQALTKIKENFKKDVYLPYLKKIAPQLTFCTHTSKGIHSDSKGDNITFINNKALPIHIVGTHSINSRNIDATGNAAALPFAAFVYFELDDNTTIGDLILTDNQNFISSLSTDKQTALEYQKTFKTVLQNHNDTPVSHERNKQILWPIHSELATTIDEIEYKVLVPLYPSVLAYENFLRINELRYSDENRQARDNRFKTTGEQKEYVSLFDLATLSLGGTKPQNISMLTSRQRGQNYLLSSTPPLLQRSYKIHLSKYAQSILDSKGLQYRCQNQLKTIFEVVKSKKNNVALRNARAAAIDGILHLLFSFARTIQNEWQAGWSIEYSNLKMSQKYWLDPYRADLADEQDFKEGRESEDWHQEIIQHFANWLVGLLKSEFKDNQQDFDVASLEWQREIEEMQKQYERAGKGVFL